MTGKAERPSQDELKQQFESQIRRHEARQSAARGFWRSLGVLGAIGWPIAVLTAAGGWGGHWLDRKFNTGHQLTLLLLLAGAGLGCYAAWRAVRESHS